MYYLTISRQHEIGCFFEWIELLIEKQINVLHLSVDLGEQFVKKEILRLTLEMTKGSGCVSEISRLTLRMTEAEIFRFATLSQNDTGSGCVLEIFRLRSEWQKGRFLGSLCLLEMINRGDSSGLMIWKNLSFSR